MSKVKTGIIVYQIESDGCLNGVFTTEISDGYIYNEVANKISSDFEELCGEYNCFYFEDGSSHDDVILNIQIKKDKKNTYKVTWTESGNLIFEGIGFKMNEKQFVVRYETSG